MGILEHDSGEWLKYKTRPWPGDQDPDELTRFLDFVVERKVRRYLEIGSRNGDSFYAVMMAMGPDACGIAIDLPENASSRRSLLDTVAELNVSGRRAVAYHGNSKDEMVIAKARKNIPYDLILIDANHTYAGVRADWEAYSDMAPIIALHDVAAPEGYMSDGRPNEVGRFWQEIGRGYNDQQLQARPGNMGGVATMDYSFSSATREIVSPGSVRGFGIVIK
jgi:predicted O-methyltransferase YrrM